MLILLALFGIFNPRSPLYVTNIPNPPRKGLIDPHGVADERGWYATSASLIYFHSDMRAMKIEGNLDLKSMENRVRQIHFYNTLGFYSYEKGPTIHVLDLWALADPLLSRLPMAWEPDWRIGHFTRILPDGYLESLDTGENKFGDQKLAEFYQKLSIITKGPIWTKERFKEILKFNFGKYDFLINQDYYHKPGPLFVDLEDLNKRQKIGAAFLSPGAVRIWRYRPLRIRMGEKSHHRYFSVSLDNNDLYEFKFFKDGKKISKVVIEPSFLASGGLNTYVLEVGAEAVEQGYDEVWVEGKKGDNWYSIGHFIPVESVSVPDSVGILSE